MKKIVLSIFLLITAAGFAANPLPPHPSVQELKKDLGVRVVTDRKEVPEEACQILLIHEASTEWSETKRLQGWSQLSLSERGREEASTLAEKIAEHKISALYASSLRSAEETAEILRRGNSALPLSLVEELKGESHGQFEGYSAQEYLRHPHFQLFYFIPAEEKLFFPCGKGGESRADVGKRVAPALKQIASAHPKEVVAVVSHDAIFHLFNFFAGKSRKEETIGVPPAGVMEIAVDRDTIYLLP